MDQLRHVVAAHNLSITSRITPSILQRAKAVLDGEPTEICDKKILDGVSLQIQGPSLTAIIGPSGSGKTTLLDSLSQRSWRHNDLVRAGQTTISSDGPHTNPAKQVAYVRQEDILLPSLTVRETLQYAADLSMGSTPNAERSAAVQKIISILRLSHCANTKIGDNWHKGCSGGEIRRTSIGIQILRDQPILFLDEPTTGLDSKAASEVIAVLRDLADQGKTVVMTLHQPASEIWDLIDNLVVLSQGSLLYAGSIEQSLGHFATAGLKVPVFENAFNYISDMIAVDTRDEQSEASSQDRVEALRRLWRERAPQHAQRVRQLSQASRSLVSGRKEDLTHFGWRLWVHSRRTLKLTIRDRLGMFASLSEGLLMGLACGLVFYQLGRDLSGIKSRQGAIYCTISMQSYLVLLYEMYRLTVDIKIFDREHADGLTTPTTFFLSRRMARFMTEDVPVPLIFSVAFYFMAGMRLGVGEFFSYFLVQFLLHIISVCTAVICVLPTREFMSASLMGNINYVIQCQCAGLFINFASFGAWVGWMRWVTQLSYAFSALCSNEFAGKVFDCPWPAGAADPRCREYTGDYIMHSLALPDRWFATPVAALSGFAVLFGLLALGALHYWSPSRRSRGFSHKRRSLKVGAAPSCPQRRAPVTVTLDELSVRNGPKFAVGPVSAHFEAGTISAVLGPSGSGKTTLLSTIAGRIDAAVRRRHGKAGCARFNGQVVDDRDISAICSFVPQHDTALLEQLTAQETLQYAACLRLPQRISVNEKMERADTVQGQMGLKYSTNTVRNMSGGEKRRLSMAVQMLSDPAVLILDEPTSGLDAFIAATIIELLQVLANEGRTIIMVVHQPRWRLLEQCAKLLLLNNDGRQAFFGSADALANLVCDPKGSTDSDQTYRANPADLVLHRLSESLPLEDHAEKESPPESPSLSCKEVDHCSDRAVLPASLGLEQRHRLAIVHVVPILLHRCATRFRRDPVLMFGRVAQIAGSGIVTVLFFTPLGYDHFAIQTRVGIIAQSSALFFVGMLNSIALYPSDLELFLGEFADGLYTAEAFFFYYTFVELPMELLGALLMGLLLVFATGLSEKADVFLLIAYTSFAIVSCGESLGMTFLSLIRHRGLAISIMSVILALCTALNGAFSLNMPAWLQGLNNLSPAKWQIQVSLTASLRGIEFSCSDSEQDNAGACLVQTGEQLLRLYNLDVSTGKAAGILIAVTFAYRLIAYLALKLRCSRLP